MQKYTVIFSVLLFYITVVGSTLYYYHNQVYIYSGFYKIALSDFSTFHDSSNVTRTHFNGR